MIGVEKFDWAWDFSSGRGKGQVSWIVERHDTGVLRLVCPVLLWARAAQLTAGSVHRIGSQAEGTSST